MPKNEMKILLVAPEVFPKIKVGGLGQFVAGVVKTLKARKIIVELVVPQKSIYGPLNSRVVQKRFEQLGQKARDFCFEENFWPDIIWAHDWSGVAVMEKFKSCPVKKIWTIHSPLSDGYYYDYSEDIDEPIDWSDDFFDFQSVVREGLNLADGVNTVSGCYAKDINSQLTTRNLVNSKIMGIANGIDFDFWNPEKDNLLAFKLKDNHWSEFKKLNKIALQQAFSLPVVDWPLFCFVSRLAEQKGIDLFFEVLPKLLGRNSAQMVVVGQGRRKYHRFFEKLKREFPPKVGLELQADFDLPHQVFAGADFLILPSKAEPGGIVVQEAARYGCLPIVRLTGGLKDQVKDGVSGLGFGPFSAVRLEEKLHQASKLWPQEGVWRLREKAREKVRSWNMIAGEYLGWFDERN